MNREFAEEILRNRNRHEAVFPSREKIYRFVDGLEELLFPHLSGEATFFSADEIEGSFAVLGRELKTILRAQQANMSSRADDVAGSFFAALPGIYRKLWLDAEAIHAGDPAAGSVDEVISAYPGFFAIYTYRIAHELYAHGVPILPRIFTEYAHVKTGIDIHPGASIGERFCIDHGTGVVVGESTVIGDHVKLYQGVTLGALSVSKDLARQKRHPTLEDNVVVYSNATILGGSTVIGHDSVIGGNVWLTRSVPPYSLVYHTNQIKVRSKVPGEEAPAQRLTTEEAD
jgi:serine O-acetyltransferase